MLSKPFFTSAPWRVEIPQRGPCVIKSPHNLYVGTGTTIDDARLMAAAPELLDALERAAEILDLNGWGIDSDVARLQAFAAIAKATGKGGADV